MKHKKVVDPLNLMSLSILYGIKHVVPEDIHNTPTEGFFCLTTTLTPLTPPPIPLDSPVLFLILLKKVWHLRPLTQRKLFHWNHTKYKKSS